MSDLLMWLFVLWPTMKLLMFIFVIALGFHVVFDLGKKDSRL